MKIPHKCPVCDGSGAVSRLPSQTGNQETWTDGETGGYRCNACSGTGIIWEEEI